MKKVYAIILAGGYSVRFSTELPKQFMKLAGKTVIEHTIETFERHPMVNEIIVVVNPHYRHYMEDIILRNNYVKVTKLLNGGITRQESSKIGVFSIEDDSNPYVLIHDAVRPFVSDKVISDVIRALEYYEAVDVAVDSPDTIIVKDESGKIVSDIPNRNELMLGQTPQGFRLEIIKKAYELLDSTSANVTDDCGVVKRLGLGKIGIVYGERFNIKITYPEDMYLADKIFQVRTNNFSVTDCELSEKLSGKVLVVFGGTSGIGKSIVNLSRKYGAVAYEFSRRLGVDVRIPDNVREALDSVYLKHGRIDYVVNTAGILSMGALEVRDYGSIKEEIDTNYYGAVVVAKESYKFLRESKGHLLLFTSSSYTRGRELYSIYSSSKAAVVNLCQAVANEWRFDGCRVNVINPERTNTELRRKNFGFEAPSTLLSPEYVASVSLCVLISNITGQVIDITKQLS